MNTIAPPAKRNGKTTPKPIGTRRKGSGARRKSDVVERHNAKSASAGGRAPAQPRPVVGTIDLVAPARKGRTVQNLGALLDRADLRLRLAWKYRDVLDPALPQNPSFHAHAWTAFEVLRPAASKAGGTGAKAALTTLSADLTTLRGAVAFTTRPGDPARRTLRFETPLRLTYALIDLAPEIIEGARALQGRFPALTDAVIAEAETSLAAARDAVNEARNRKIDDAVNRLDTVDRHQLALDVLLDCLDHLRAAARTTLHKTRAKVCAVLSAAIEPTRTRAAGGTSGGTPVGGSPIAGEALKPA